MTQVCITAAKYFRDQPGLVLVAFDAPSLGPKLTWEVSRGGDLFPHLYAVLPTSQAISVRELPLGPDGMPLITQDKLAC